MKSEIKKIGVSALFSFTWIMQSATNYNEGKNVPLYVICVFIAFMLLNVLKNRGVGILSGIAIHIVIAIIDMNYLLMSLPLYFLALAHKEITTISGRTDKKQKNTTKDNAFMFIWFNVFSGLGVLGYTAIGWVNDPPEYISALTDCLHAVYWYFIMFIPLVIFSFRKSNRKKSEQTAFDAQAKSLRIIYILSMITFVEQMLLYYGRHLDTQYIAISIFTPWIVYVCSIIVCCDDPVVEYIATYFKAFVDKCAVANKVEEK